ncbi:MAG TPA: RiPP maturation radical SAM protein 1, partial [Armatimonadetes bacterium]|nr:RiPP maturation radical SAM protein 1 [Armatimonadota bacterium]
KLDALPLPDYDSYFKTLSRCPSVAAKAQVALTAESSRGCWWGHKKGCTFCGLNGQGGAYASKTPQRFRSELHTLSKRYGSTLFSITDNIIDKRYFDTLLPMLADDGAPYRLFYETKSNLRRYHLASFRKAGIDWIQPGIESLSTAHLRHMRKGAHAWEHVYLLRLAMEYGMRLQWFILHDFPGEKSEWYEEMAHLVPLINHLQPPVNMIPLQFCRFSEYHEKAEQYGLRLAPPPLAPMAYPFERVVLQDLLFSFEPESGRDCIENTVLSMLTEKAGKRRLRAALADWTQAFWSPQRPQLTMHDDGQTCRLRDTRSIATTPVHVMTGKVRKAYLAACEDCRPLADIQKLAGAQTDTIVTRLVDQKLAVILDDRLVGLAAGPARYAFPPRW